ncbi:MAG: FAD/NAD(P)-binding protein [Pelobium sp.]
MENGITRIAILGGGPSALFIFKKLLNAGHPKIEISIFERKNVLGTGMPYSEEGARKEHITNVSENEIPELETTMQDWIKTAPAKLLESFQINAKNFNEYKVLPRLFFGEYLADQFQLLIKKAKSLEIPTHVFLNCNIVDVIDKPELGEVWLKDEDEKFYQFEHLIICSGHNWPNDKEDKKKGYFDSPYPPSKLKGIFNHPIAIRGSSLTAIDAIRTLANDHGKFIEKETGEKIYQLHEDYPDFEMIMHSRSGLLPAVRFHLEDSHLSGEDLLSEEELKAHGKKNDGFIDLDFIFEENFKNIFIEKDPAFYERIKDMNLEAFVSEMMELRERIDAFELLKAEYREAEKSIKRKDSVYWKELLAMLSFSLNYPAKYFSAEDMLRLKKNLMPLISVVIAFVPQSSCEVLMALHDSGVLKMISVGEENDWTISDKGGVMLNYKNEEGDMQESYYQTFVDCIGQPHLNLQDFPFKSLVEDQTISSAYLKFKDFKNGEEMFAENRNEVLKTEAGDFYLKVPGIAINDNFQVLNSYGELNNRIFMMAVPYIGGFNPDYSGLDFSDAASDKITSCLTDILEKENPVL